MRLETLNQPAFVTLQPNIYCMHAAGQADRVMDGAASPSISDDEQYQTLDSSSLWQQGPGHVASNGMPAGTVPAPDVEPEVHQASMDDREVLLSPIAGQSAGQLACNLSARIHTCPHTAFLALLHATPVLTCPHELLPCSSWLNFWPSAHVSIQIT